ncbi:hypothetical protein BFN03_17840 [Rhodococcus sp. WMMA185]|uniref:hypothetical protein n=1 Tax=Rhodococcus sp. WMMA185 TaxID=679318 RepID=UPI000878FEC1|nr:hypothetical protein [Rhodococcus sp. WMMA185]AOW93892.1 hypothetical protein BFN03_17840 [Rhodococcus sp. WMMA185]
MTRATDSLTNLLSTERAEAVQSQVSDGVETALAAVSDSTSRVKESEAVDRALRLTRSAALAAVRGTGQLSLFLGRQGAALARKGYECAKTTPVPKVAREMSVPAASATEPVEQKKSRKGRRIAVVVLVGAAVAGGVVLAKRRRREHPPVAAAPPNLRDFNADSEQSTSTEETSSGTN